MVKDYPQSRERLVLDHVKKYPFYSLDKLNEELPEVSRHAIQRILEKNDLSTVEKRVAFAGGQGQTFSFLEKIKRLPLYFKGADLEKLKESVASLKMKSFSKRQLAKTAVSLGMGLMIFLVAKNLIFASNPQVELSTPGVDFVNKGEILFVSGRVSPPDSGVTVNGAMVSLNGDGTFTAVVKIPMGKSTLRVEAARWRKKASVVRLVTREPTADELAKQEEEERAKKRETIDKVAVIERTVNDLIAAKEAVLKPGSVKGGRLQILNNRIKEEAGFSSIIGEVLNLGEEPVSWVMVTARFYDEKGQGIEARHGFATSFGELLEPGEKASFETQANTREFARYTLEISWEDAAVAGVATEAAKREEVKKELVE